MFIEVYRNEDALLSYFKIIEKLAKNNFRKYMDKNYTSAHKRANKNKLKDFLKNFIKDNLKVTMTTDMLNTVTDEVYKKIWHESYDSIFLKISFFCQLKGFNIDEYKLHKLVKIRNKLAHGDIVDDDSISSSLNIAISLSNNFISLYFFNKKCEDISISTPAF